jgi:hypothetical protein
LDINLKKDLSMLLHAIHSPFYWQITKKTILFSGFNNVHKKICETRKLELSDLRFPYTMFTLQPSFKPLLLGGGGGGGDFVKGFRIGEVLNAL